MNKFFRIFILTLICIISFSFSINKEKITIYVAMDNPDFKNKNYYCSKDDSSVINIHDGPYIKWKINSSKVIVSYFDHNPKNDKTKKVTRKYQISEEDTSFSFKGFAYDSLNYFIDKHYYPETAKYNNVEKIMVIGDIHGEYDYLLKLLRNTKVIDEKNNWIWGHGHIVFCGDIFDRGNNVTESLWLINQLEKKAKKKGGRVHFLLGNHEIMALNDDARYLSPKYCFICNRFELNYSNLYNKKSVMGRWLRSKNTVIKINDILFTHAGISPKIAENKLSIDSINKTVRNYLDEPKKSLRKPITNLVIGNEGPLWYRGYIMNLYNYKKISNQEIDEILNFYNASHIIFGHTDLPKIQPLFNSKLIDIAIPFKFRNVKEQVLLIEKNKYYRLFLSGERENINN
ncbi:MAG: metallophosphoesterase [Bacteroidetes bacterium]|nr:metallophosphoesterase [Bacteroidota bacterium]